MSGWSDEGAERRGQAGTAGERPQKPLPPGWSVRPRGMRQRPPRDLDVRPPEGRPSVSCASFAETSFAESSPRA